MVLSMHHHQTQGSTALTRNHLFLHPLLSLLSLTDHLIQVWCQVMDILVKTREKDRKLGVTNIIILDSLKQTKRAFQCYTTVLYIHFTSAWKFEWRNQLKFMPTM